MFITLFVVGDVLSRLLTGAWTAWVSPGRHRRRSPASSATASWAAPLLWGVDGGILATLAVGIPYILTFYFMLALVEDSGYMNAAAFLSDRVMHRFGLHGRAVIPLIAAGGCNVPAIIAHALAHEHARARHRLHARRAHALQRAHRRHHRRRGRLRGLAVGAVRLRRRVRRRRPAPAWRSTASCRASEGAFVMEMFPFRRPVLRQVARKTWRRFREFVWDAAPIILLGSMVLGLLYETGFIWKLTAPLAPVVEGWLMLPAVAGLTLIFAVLRKELALQLLLAFAAVSIGGAVTELSTAS